MQAVRQTSFLATLMVSLCLGGCAQTGLNAVHVNPGNQSIQLDASPVLARAAGIIRKSVELVLVPVTVIDESYRIHHWTRAGEFPSL